MKYLSAIIVVLFAISVIGCSSTKKTAKEDTSGPKTITTPSGLQYTDLNVGTGPSPTAGQEVTVHYIGTLANGTKFDASYDRNQPFKFRLGMGEVIKGWDEGILTMKVGGKRRLIIPPQLGYASRAAGPIPANSTLYFDVELISVK